jgi:hypothetical protein
MIDYDKYRNDIAEQHNLSLQCQYFENLLG